MIHRGVTVKEICDAVKIGTAKYCAIMKAYKDGRSGGRWRRVSSNQLIIQYLLISITNN